MLRMKVLADLQVSLLKARKAEWGDSPSYSAVAMTFPSVAGTRASGPTEVY